MIEQAINGSSNDRSDTITASHDRLVNTGNLALLMGGNATGEHRLKGGHGHTNAEIGEIHDKSEINKSWLKHEQSEAQSNDKLTEIKDEFIAKAASEPSDHYKLVKNRKTTDHEEEDAEIFFIEEKCVFGIERKCSGKSRKSKSEKNFMDKEMPGTFTMTKLFNFFVQVDFSKDVDLKIVAAVFFTEGFLEIGKHDDESDQ